ncbi:MAG: alkaline phosphatase family protein [Betaproteobacteria bacterium]|nr:MAG: alkaline phosphatase family protein [Betaproteobacteria bacterium]
MTQVRRADRNRLRASLIAFAAGFMTFMQGGVASAGLTLMHGYVDYASALIWIQTDAPGPVEVVWRMERDADVHRATFDASATENNIVLARLTGLLPGEQVSYAVVGDGERREGLLRAQPRWTRPADAQDITIAIGSCFFLADANPVWGSQNYGGGYEILDAIAAKKPDVMVWMGDNLYFQPQDELDPASMASRYRRQRTLPSLKTLLTSASHVAIWDDHDYGPNDADLSYTMKGEALTLFRRYWANPSYGLPETPGIFGRARFGDVDIFLLDDRYYRSANKLLDGPDKTMFGAKQLEWLKNALVYSSAPIKLVVNGSQMWNRVNRFEGWNNYSAEQRAFADWLLAQRVDGLIFLSGDRHFTELLKIERVGGYPLFEFTSSPLTSGTFDPPGEKDNPDIVQGTYVVKRQFGMIRVTGPGNDRTVALESYDQKGELQWRHEIRARNLGFAR